MYCLRKMFVIAIILQRCVERMNDKFGAKYISIRNWLLKFKNLTTTKAKHKVKMSSGALCVL